MPGWVHTIAAVIFGLALVVAGGTKIIAGRSWEQQGRALGAPGWALPAVPYVEIVVGAAIAAGLLSPWPTLIGSALLVGFTALIGRRLMAGEHPPCACFGSWTMSPIGWRDLARNAALLGVAVVALWR